MTNSFIWENNLYKKNCLAYLLIFQIQKWSTGGDQHLERVNLERPFFRNFGIPNIEITKDELLDFFIFNFFLLV